MRRPRWINFWSVLLLGAGASGLNAWGYTTFARQGFWLWNVVGLLGWCLALVIGVAIALGDD
jgi:hypothetical protein